MKVQLPDLFDVAAPYYTLYPTTAEWQAEPPAQEQWIQKVQHAFSIDNEISLFIRMPFDKVEESYMESLLQEWRLYRQLFDEKPLLREWYWGGNSPAFFSPGRLELLVHTILEETDLPEAFEFGWKAHPGITTPAHLEFFNRAGFRRLGLNWPAEKTAFGQQPSLEQVHQLVLSARRIGYSSLEVDLVLSHRHGDKLRDDLYQIMQWKPDRIGLYPFKEAFELQNAPAPGPEKCGQNRESGDLYQWGRRLLEEAGYIEIGLDLFALPGDPLFEAMEMGTLHRNASGYTPFFTPLSIALGRNAVSDSWDAFIQNSEDAEIYCQQVAKGNFPIARGHLLTAEDEILRGHILNVLCRYETTWQDPKFQSESLAGGIRRLSAFEKRGLVEIYPVQLKITPEGRPFMRYICRALDGRYWAINPGEAV